MTVDATMAAPQTSTGEDWPALPYEEWKDTLVTLNMWTQIVGKVKLALAPFLNDWWQVPFSVTARGLTTSTIPLGSRIFQIDFDFVDHRLNILVANGSVRSLILRPCSVAEFYQEFMAALGDLGIRVKITTNPVEVENTIPFDEDSVHAAYDRTYVQRWWRILLQVDRLLQRYRTRFVGKSSPVQFWWGAFDLSQTRYSGRPLPERQWRTRWQSLGAHQEYAEAGFWPGGGNFVEPAFFAFAVPEPPGLRDAIISPGPAGYQPQLGEFILPYKEVRRSSSPDKMVLDFLNSTYEVEADLGGWDRKTLELPDPLPGP